MSLSRPVLPIRSRCEWRREVDGRARGVWQIKRASGWGRSKVSCVGGQRRWWWSHERSPINRGDLALDAVLRPLHESGRWVSEASGEARMGVSYSIYELKNYSEVSTAYIWEVEREAMTGKVGELCTVQKRNCGRVSITKSGSGMSGSRDQKSNRKR